jgi:hypothetical protein
MVRQRAAHPFEQRRPQQQLAHVGRLALEHLGHEVGGDGPLAARELAHEAVRLGASGEREGGQPQPGGPALGPVAEEREALRGQLDAAAREQLARLLGAEGQIGGAELGEHPGHPQPVQAQAGIVAGAQHQPGRRREVLDEDLEQIQGLRRSELVQVVDHQHQGMLE